jgi:hypothetical protein
MVTVKWSEKNDPNLGNSILGKSERRLYFNFILFQSLKTRYKLFIYFLKIQSKHFKKQVTTIQPLSTFPSKGSKSIFNLKEISVKRL